MFSTSLFLGFGLLLKTIADVLLAGREADVADAGDGGIDTAGKKSQPEIGAGAALIALGAQIGMVDDDAADPAKEKGKQETNDVFAHG